MLPQIYKSLCEHVPEIQLFYMIHRSGGAIWKLSKDLNQGRIPLESAAIVKRDLALLTEQVEYAVDQTKRFGIEIPRDEQGQPTHEYREWYRKWNEYTQGLSDENAEKIFEVLEMIARYIDTNSGPVPDVFTQQLAHFRPFQN